MITSVDEVWVEEVVEEANKYTEALGWPSVDMRHVTATIIALNQLDIRLVKRPDLPRYTMEEIKRMWNEATEG